jgi:hypothetical protein
MLAMRRALRSGRLPLGRSRPAFEAALREHLGGVDEADWRTFGLEPGASEDAIRARWREQAKRLHPDAGGDPRAFVAMQAVYQRLLHAGGTEVSSLPDTGELFDPVIVNPKKGFFDFYSTKLWPGAMAMLLVVRMLSPRAGTATTSSPYSGGSTTIGSGSTVSGTSTTPLGATGTAHTCWYTGNELNGCQDDTSTAMLFGSPAGTRTTCWFVEPLGDGEYAKCR